MVLVVVAAVEVLSAARSAARMFETAGGSPLHGGQASAGDLSVIVPTLDEERRVGATLAALSRCGDEVAEIVVVDGGSRDATAAVVAGAAAHDARIRFINAGAPPPGWNGKAWNLEAGVCATSRPWVACVDADVECAPDVLAAAVARATSTGLDAISVATRQRLAEGALIAMLHPALLTTLVYRAGLPNTVARTPRTVQANGQVFVARRDALIASRAIAAARASRCEDVTIARSLAARGGAVGFFEGDASVQMHDSFVDCARNWPRSLPLRDAFVPPAELAMTLALVLCAQALPLPTLLLALAWNARGAAMLAGIAVAMRVGVLAGTRRAYVDPSPAYWLSPLFDLPALALVIASAVRRTHVWRGRRLVMEAAL